MSFLDENNNRTEVKHKKNIDNFGQLKYAKNEYVVGKEHNHRLSFT